MRREELIAQGRNTRAAIVRAAAIQFALVGYSGSSLSEVAALLGKPKAALRHHFGSKADLAVAIAEHQNLVWVAMRDAALARGAHGLEGLLSVLSTAIDDSFTEPYAKAIIAMRITQRETGLELPAVPFSWFGVVQDYLEEARALGQIPATTAITSSSRLFIDATFGVHQRHVQSDSTTVETDYVRLWNLLLAGLGVTEPERWTRTLTRLDWSVADAD